MIENEEIIIPIPEHFKNNDQEIADFKSVNNIPNAKYVFESDQGQDIFDEPPAPNEPPVDTDTPWFKRFEQDSEETFNTHYTSLKEKATKAETLEQENTLTKTQLADLNKQLQFVKNPFVNDKFQKLNELAKITGKDDLGLLSKVLDIDSQSDVDVLLLSEMYQSTKPIDLDLVREGIMDTYDLERPEDYDDLSESEQKKIDRKIEIKKLSLTKAADKIRDEYKAKIDSIKVPEIIDDKAKQERFEAEKQRLAPSVKAVLENDFKDTIKLGDDYQFDVVIPKDTMAKYNDIFSQLLLNAERDNANNITEVGYKKAYNTLIARYVLPEQSTDIMKSLKSKMDSEKLAAIEAVHEQYRNPNKPKHNGVHQQHQQDNRNQTQDEMLYGKGFKPTWIV